VIHEIRKIIRENQTFCVVSHFNPDADAYGSTLGLGLALEKDGKQVCFLNHDGMIPKFQFLPGSEKITSIPTPQVDCLFILDCGDLKRTGEQLVLPRSKIVVNIDHHISNDRFGNFALVDVSASSTCEIIYGIVEDILSPEIATNLLAGIYADTGSLRYGNTSTKTLNVASRLLEAGASLALISERLFGAYSISSVKLHALALSQIRIENKVAWVVVTKQMLEQAGATSEDADGLAEKGRDIEGVRISASVRYSPEEDLWRISLRTHDKSVDLSSIAAEFGGGGHKAAAAFRWRKSYEELESILFSKLKAL
jgi:phosphoesterase RecJ-like protein